MRLIQQADDMNVLGLNVLVYGDPGIGKTTLAFTAPNPLLLDFDRGLHRASHRKDALQFDSWLDLIDSSDALDKLISQHETIVIDTAGTMIEAMQAYLVRSNPALQRNGIKLWGETKKLFQDFYLPLKLSGKNIVYIAHAKEKDEGDIRIKRPLIPGSSYDLLMQACDLVGYYTMVNNQRVLTFDLTDNITAKNCASIAPVKIGSLHDMQTSLTDIILSAKTSIAVRSKDQEEAIALVNIWVAKAEAAKDPNKFVTQLSKEGLADAVKRTVWAGVVQTFSAKGLVWNAETKQFTEVVK